VTTVVMTRNRWPDLRRTLPRHDRPVIVVDNGSRDGTPALVRTHFPDVDVVAAGHNLGATARNLGVSRASTPYVAFADDDSWWEPGALARAAGALDAHPRLAVVAGRVVVEPDQQPDPICRLMEQSPLARRRDGLPGPAVRGFLACGAVVRRDAFLAAGGFDDVVFFMGEEDRLAIDLVDAGWELAYLADVVAHHDPSPQSRDRHDRAARATRNRVLTAVMRRPWPVVGRTLVDALRSGPPGRHGARSALPLLTRALRRRRRTSSRVEDELRLLARAARG
jgi:GT2 family glycosyltransferase